MREEGYRYVVASSPSAIEQFDPELALDLGDRFQGQVTAPTSEVSEDGGEVRLYCRSEERAHKERGHRLSVSAGASSRG